MRDMDDRRDDAAAAAPGIAVADEEAVAEKWRQPVAHLRALSLEALVMLDKGLRDRIGAIADKQSARQQAGRKYFPLEGAFFPNFEEVSPREAQCRKRGKRPYRPFRKGRNEIIHGLPRARS